MKIIMCLGNPGIKYSLTRHNTGFMFADLLAKKSGCGFVNESKFKSLTAEGIHNNELIRIIKPQTYMNLSGEALSALKNFYKTDLNNFFIVYDDISLNLGTIRFKSNGSDGGHNGIKSIIKHAGSADFDRLKIGIGPQPPFMKSEDYVLQNFTEAQKPVLTEVLNESVNAFLYYCDNDIYKAQNKYN